MSTFNKQNPFVVIWKIKNYSLILPNRDIRSSAFDTHFVREEQWILSYIRGSLDSESSLKLIFNPRSLQIEKEITVYFKFEIIGIVGHSLASEVRIRRVRYCQHLEWCHKNLLVIDSDIVEERNTFLTEDCLTVQISMWGDFSERIGITRILLRSEIKYEKCILMWYLDNFSSCTSKSKRITFPNNDEFDINLINSDDDEIKITIREVGNLTGILKCGICLLDSSGCKRDFRVKEHHFSGSDDKLWIFPTFLKKSKLFGEKNEFLVNDVLSLHCTFAIATSETMNSVEYDYIKFAKISVAEDCPDKYLWESTKDGAPLNMLQKDLQQLYSCKKMTDVTIRTGDKTLSAHKCVLAARSPVFSAMFEQEMAEKKSNIVDILDVDYDIVDTMVMFIYGSTIENLNYERAGKLMIAADKYQIASLKEECSIFLKSSISDKTIYEILTLYDLVQDERLIASSVDYIKSNTKSVMQSEEWNELVKTKGRLVIEVLSRLVLDK